MSHFKDKVVIHGYELTKEAIAGIASSYPDATYHPSKNITPRWIEAPGWTITDEPVNVGFNGGYCYDFRDPRGLHRFQLQATYYGSDVLSYELKRTTACHYSSKFMNGWLRVKVQYLETTIAEFRLHLPSLTDSEASDFAKQLAHDFLIKRGFNEYENPDMYWPS